MPATVRTAALGSLLALAMTTVGCGSGSGTTTAARPASSTPPASQTTLSASSSSSSSSSLPLPGTGRPPITVGDKNYTEQFVLGELYRQALAAQGYDVAINRNIGPTEVTIPALESGRVDVYPEYLSAWNTGVAGLRQQFATQLAAYLAGQRYAVAHGLQLLSPTPFSDTPGLAVTRALAVRRGLTSLADLAGAGPGMTAGGPPQFEQAADGLPAIDHAYGFTTGSFTPLEVGAQYQALDQGKAQLVEVNTTDGQLVNGRYRLLRDPRRVFGWGNVVPVISVRSLLSEGPAFSATLDRVDALLTTRTIRRLNAAVDVGGQNPAAVAKQFLQSHGLIPLTPP